MSNKRGGCCWSCCGFGPARQREDQPLMGDWRLKTNVNSGWILTLLMVGVASQSWAENFTLSAVLDFVQDGFKRHCAVPLLVCWRGFCCLTTTFLQLCDNPLQHYILDSSFDRADMSMSDESPGCVNMLAVCGDRKVQLPCAATWGRCCFVTDGYSAWKRSDLPTNLTLWWFHIAKC